MSKMREIRTSNWNGFNEKIDYVGAVCISPENDSYSLDGFNEEGYWYIAGRLSQKTPITESLWPLKQRGFNFGVDSDYCPLTIAEAKERGLAWDMIELKILTELNSIRRRVIPITRTAA